MAKKGDNQRQALVRLCNTHGRAHCRGRAKSVSIFVPLETRFFDKAGALASSEDAFSI